MYSPFNHNPCNTIVSWNSSTNPSDEMNIRTFYNDLSSLAQHIPKYHIVIIGGDMNAQISKFENNKFSLSNLPNRNGEYLRDFSLENSHSCINIPQQNESGKQWTYIYPIEAKEQVEYISINKKCIFLPKDI